jgi:hypothetical protein
MKIEVTVTEILTRKDAAYVRLNGKHAAGTVGLQFKLDKAQRDLMRVNQQFTLELKPKPK